MISLVRNFPSPKFNRVAAILGWLFLLAFQSAVQSTPPVGYYTGIENLVGGDLKDALHKIIKRDHRTSSPQHTVLLYNNLRQPLHDIWPNSITPANITLVYSSPSIAASSVNSWDREHLWPSARGVEGSGPDYSDMFHVVPAKSNVNSTRRDRFFDLSNPADKQYKPVGSIDDAPLVGYDSDSWEPAPYERGDIARALFYMDVRYNGSEANAPDLTLVAYSPWGLQMGNLTQLLAWHESDPPDESERIRNNLIYTKYQGNRNPFIDHPELVSQIWGSGNAADQNYYPFVRVETTSASAIEQDSSEAVIVLSLDRVAGPNGLVVQFGMGGDAQFQEYMVSGTGVNYDPTTGNGQISIAPGLASVLVYITPIQDGVPEDSESVDFIIFQDASYEVTPDASSRATITITDSPTFPVFWNFDSVSSSTQTIPANQGGGYVSLQNWQGGVANFAGFQGNSLVLRGTAGNNSSIDFGFSMSGYQSLSMNFRTEGSGTGYSQGLWSFSVDGGDFTNLFGVNTAKQSSGWALQTLNFSEFSSINNASSVILRYTLSGATSSSGNNKIDNFQLIAERIRNNDNFLDSQTITGLPASVIGNNLEATREPDEPLHDDIESDKSVWWSWTAPVSAQVTISTYGSNFDTLLAVYTGIKLDALTKVASNDEYDVFYDNTSLVRFSAVAGETYRIAVDGYYGDIGQISLKVNNITNDNFSSPFVLNGLPVSSVGSNVGATIEPYEPRHYDMDVENSVWWKWTATENSTVIINTDGSGFDTVLAVYTGLTIDSLTEVASNDDHEGNDNGESQAVFRATAGQTYMIAVSSKNYDEEGQVFLSIKKVSGNDFFEDPVVLSGLPVSSTGSNVGATTEPNEPEHAGFEVHNSLWWKWTAAESSAVTINTEGSGFDTVLAVYTGLTIDSLTEVASNDDYDGYDYGESHVAFRATAGQTYMIVVSSQDDYEAGQILLTIQRGVSNDFFEDAVVLSGLPVSSTGSNVGATTEPNEPKHAGFEVYNSLWWKWTSTENSTVIINTEGSGFNTVLSVYTGVTVDSLAEVASNDNYAGFAYGQSRVVFRAIAGQTYMIAVSGTAYYEKGLVLLSLTSSTGLIIENLSKNGGPPGDLIFLNGYNLYNVNEIKFSGLAADFTVINDNQVSAIIPEGAVSGYIDVSSPNGNWQSGWFEVGLLPSKALLSIDRKNLNVLNSQNASFSISAQSLPGALVVESPSGFEISLDGINFSNAIEILAPLRFDEANNYSKGWSNQSNQGYGFDRWHFDGNFDAGTSGFLIANPVDSGIGNFGNQAFCIFATPPNSGAWASGQRFFDVPMAIGDTFSFRWALYGSIFSTGSNSVSIYSGDAWLLSLSQFFPNNVIIFTMHGSPFVLTGPGASITTWSFKLLDSTTLKVSAAGINGNNEINFTVNLPVAGAPDNFIFESTQIEPDLKNRAYFNDLRLDSPLEGGGNLPDTVVHVRKSNDNLGQGGNILFISGGQQLGTLSLNADLQGGNSYENWQQTQGLDPLGNGAYDADPDGDGHSNLQEFLFGGNPLSGQGTLCGHGLESGNFVLTFLGRATGGNYSVQSTGNLVSGPWVREQINSSEAVDQSGVPGGYKRFQFLILVEPGNRFYRLKGDWLE